MDANHSCAGGLVAVVSDRIKLAEAMGWDSTSSYTSPDGVKESYRWRDPETGTAGNTTEDLPDPFTDDHDCMMLVSFLIGNGWHVHLMIHKSGATVLISNRDGEHSWNGDDYRQGVCELALEVLAND